MKIVEIEVHLGGLVPCPAVRIAEHWLIHLHTGQISHEPQLVTFYAMDQ